MVQNTLKQQARSFMEKHDVPYSTALRAVDEPLHELRDFAELSGREFSVLYPHFRLIGEESVYSPAFPELNHELGWPDYLGTIQAAGFSYFAESRDFLREMGKRLQLIEDAGAENIWEYRMLRRAGLLDSKAPALGPLFHHYGARIGEGIAALFSEGSQLGIFGVSIARSIDIQDRFSLLPVTEEQLSALRDGEPAGALNLPPRRRPAEDGTFPRESWERSYSLLATSIYGPFTGRNELTSLRIFLRRYPDDLQAVFDDLGLRSEDFVLRDLDGEPFTFTLSGGDIITVEEDGRTIYAGSSFGVLQY